MDKFDDIIKNKVEQFEVPYNEAHWAEMDGKLERLRIAKIKKTVLSVAAGVIGISLAAYLIIPNVLNDKGIAESTDAEKVVAVENNAIETEISNQENNSSQQLEQTESNPSELQLVDDSNNSTETNSTNDNEIIETSLNETNSTELTEKPDIIIERNNSSSEASSKEVNPDFIVYNNKVCLGEKVSFEPMTTDGPISYVWNFGDGKISYKTSPSHAYEHSGNYDITLTIIDRQTGKEYTSIKRNEVIILANTSSTFTYLEESKKHDDNKLKYPYTLFKVKNKCDDCTYSWDFGNGVTAMSNTTKTIYKKEGSYNVSLTTENANGCISSIERRVTIKEGVNLYAPNAFTPSQDNVNETFIPKALVEWDSQFEMTIVNQTGNTVYKTSDKNDPWNGKLNNSGQIMPEGVYFWQVVITDAYGVKRSYQGDIKLMK